MHINKLRINLVMPDPPPKLTDNNALDAVPESQTAVSSSSRAPGREQRAVCHAPNGENETRITNNRAFDWGGYWYTQP